MSKMALRVLGIVSLGIAAISTRAADLPPLNTPATTEHFVGKFVWDDLFTTDPTTAVKFYSDLFGWTSTPIQRPNRLYTVMSLDGRPIAGITLLPEKLASATPHGRWVGFVSVDDVGRAAAVFTTAGGKIIFPIKTIPQRGTQAVIETEDGLIVGLIHSSTGDPAEYKADPNEWVWAKFFVKDSTTEIPILHSAFGYDATPESQVEKPDTFILSTNDYARASLGRVPDRPNAKPGWLGFIRVEDIDDTVTKAVSLGAKVLSPAHVIDVKTRMAVLGDPTGAPFGVVQLAEDATSQGQ